MLIKVPDVADGDRDEASVRLVAVAERLGRERRALVRAFGASADLFGDPGFDLLLRIYLAQARGESLDCGDGALGRELRWAERLESRGLAMRIGTETAQFRLTPQGMSLMDTYLEQLREG